MVALPGIRTLLLINVISIIWEEPGRKVLGTTAEAVGVPDPLDTASTAGKIMVTTHPFLLKMIGITCGAGHRPAKVPETTVDEGVVLVSILVTRAAKVLKS